MSLAILKACNAAELSKQQWRVMGAILEKTLGYNKWSDDISMSQLAQLSHLRRDKIYTVLKSLKALGLIQTQKGKYGRIITLHPDYQTHFNYPKNRAKSEDIEPKTDVNPAPKQVQNHTQNGAITIKTTNKTTTLNYPPNLTPHDQQQAQQQLNGIETQTAQTILDV